MRTVKFPPGAMAGGFCGEMARWRNGGRSIYGFEARRDDEDAQGRSDGPG